MKTAGWTSLTWNPTLRTSAEEQSRRGARAPAAPDAGLSPETRRRTSTQADQRTRCSGEPRKDRTPPPEQKPVRGADGDAAIVPRERPVLYERLQGKAPLEIESLRNDAEMPHFRQPSSSDGHRQPLRLGAGTPRPLPPGPRPGRGSAPRGDSGRRLAECPRAVAARLGHTAFPHGGSGERLVACTAVHFSLEQPSSLPPKAHHQRSWSTPAWPQGSCGERGSSAPG